MPLCSTEQLFTEGSEIFSSGLNGKTTPFHSDGEDTGGLSSDLSGFRCVSTVKLGREEEGGVLIIL